MLTLPNLQVERFFLKFGVIPNNLTNYFSSNIYTLFTSMFLHGGILHLVGNMLYLYIFGDNVENIMGHFRYLIFYLICGIGASFLQVFVMPSSIIPMVGASGAISGILGAYVLKFPRANVSILIFIFFFIRIVKVPALFVLGFWFFIQLSEGLTSLGLDINGGVAWFAHVGGFIAGLLAVNLFEKKKVRIIL
jgi:membrane associated rhomboid family serine protease